MEVSDSRTSGRGIGRAPSRRCSSRAAVTDGLARTAGYRLHHGSPAWSTTLELLDEDARPLLVYRVDDASSLTGTTWLLESVDGAPALVGVGAQPATLAFDEPVDGARPAQGAHVAGSTGCNGFSATYFATGSILSIGELVTAGDPCTPDLTEQDGVVRGILDSTSLGMSFPPGDLVLTSHDDRRSLRYRQAAPLEGQAWVLDRHDAARLGGEDVMTLFLVPDPATAPDATQRYGTLSGEGPCRAYEGTYRTDGLLVAFEGLAPGPGRCAHPGAERSWDRRLRRAAFAVVDRRRLRLRDRYGEVLATFDAPGLP